MRPTTVTSRRTRRRLRATTSKWSTPRLAADVTDFTPLLTKIKAEHPDLLVMGIIPAQVKAVANQMVDLGGVAKSFLTPSANSTTTEGMNPPFNFDFLAVGGVDPNIQGASLDKFRAAYQSVNGKALAPDDESNGAAFYGPVKGLVAELEAAGTVDDTQEIAAAMTSVKVDGAAGAFVWNADHFAIATQQFCELPANGGKLSCTVYQPAS
jgi:ABC-type branched-subunit amino acid transport system substrate-binding protein